MVIVRNNIVSCVSIVLLYIGLFASSYSVIDSTCESDQRVYVWNTPGDQHISVPSHETILPTIKKIMQQELFTPLARASAERFVFGDEFSDSCFARMYYTNAHDFAYVVYTLAQLFQQSHTKFEIALLYNSRRLAEKKAGVMLSENEEECYTKYIVYFYLRYAIAFILTSPIAVQAYNLMHNNDLYCNDEQYTYIMEQYAIAQKLFASACSQRFVQLVQQNPEELLRWYTIIRYEAVWSLLSALQQHDKQWNYIGALVLMYVLYQFAAASQLEALLITDQLIVTKNFYKQVLSANNNADILAYIRMVFKDVDIRIDREIVECIIGINRYMVESYNQLQSLFLADDSNSSVINYDIAELLWTCIQTTVSNAAQVSFQSSEMLGQDSIITTMLRENYYIKQIVDDVCEALFRLIPAYNYLKDQSVIAHGLVSSHELNDKDRALLVKEMMALGFTETMILRFIDESQDDLNSIRIVYDDNQWMNALLNNK